MRLWAKLWLPISLFSLELTFLLPKAFALNNFDSNQVQLPYPCDGLQLNAHFEMTQQYSASNQILAVQSVALAEMSDLEFVEESFKAWGFEKVTFIGPQNKGSTAIIAERPEMIAIVHRGTQSITESLRDASFLPAKIKIPGIEGYAHRGFLDQFKVIKQDLDKNISPKETRPIFIFGHSLGGAAATFTALYLQAKSLDVWGIYTSGQPVVGDQVYQGLLAHNFKGRYFRLVSKFDIIPNIPPSKANADFVAALLPKLQGTVASIIKKLNYSHHAGETYLVENTAEESKDSPLLLEREYWSRLKESGDSDSLIHMILEIASHQSIHPPLNYLCALGNRPLTE